MSGLVRVRIKKNVTFRGITFYDHDYFLFSPRYAKHVTENLGIAEYMTDQMWEQRLADKNKKLEIRNTLNGVEIYRHAQ